LFCLAVSAWCLLQVHGYFAGLAMVVLVVIGLAAVVFFRRIDNSPRQAFVFAGLFLAFRPRHTCFWLVVFARKSLVAATVGHHAVVQAALLLAIAAVYLLLRPYNRMHAWLHRHLRHPVRRPPRPSTPSSSPATCAWSATSAGVLRLLVPLYQRQTDWSKRMKK
jgi:hypothetical protein